MCQIQQENKALPRNSPWLRGKVKDVMAGKKLAFKKNGNHLKKKKRTGKQSRVDVDR